MPTVDLAIVGRLGPDAIAAVGVGITFVTVIVLVAAGTLLSLDPLVSQAYGAGDRRLCRQYLADGAWAALIAGVTASALGLGVAAILPMLGVHGRVLHLAVPYARVIAVSAIPFLLFTAFRRYLQATGRSKPVMITVVSAVIGNAALDWVLIFGHLGVRPLGTQGAAWAMLVSRMCMAIALFVVVVVTDRGRLYPTSRTSRLTTTRRLLVIGKLGMPAGIQYGLDAGIFAAVTAMASRLESVSLAAHQIVLQIVTLTFMVPLGIASVSAVRVGHATGCGDPAAAARAGWAAVIVGFIITALLAAAMVGVPWVILDAFTNTATVRNIAVMLLASAAGFQIFDGLQGITTGNLRGLGDTHTPMWANLVCHWLVGLPMAYALCFWYGMDVRGLWLGLFVGLALLGCTLLLVWRWRSKRLTWPRTDGQRSPATH